MSVVFDEVSAEVEPSRSSGEAAQSGEEKKAPEARWPGVIGDHERRARRARRLAAH